MLHMQCNAYLFKLDDAKNIEFSGIDTEKSLG